MRFIRLILAWFTLFTSLSFAQHERFDELAEQGENALKAGNYKRAVYCFEEIVNNAPTYVAIIGIKFDLGWGYYLVGEYLKAIPLFEELSGPRSSGDDMREQSLFLLAECHARIAGEISEDDEEQGDKRNKELGTAIKLHTDFQAKYPKGANIAESFYGRGYAYYLQGDFEKSELDLLTVINKYPAGATVVDAKYLLANVYAKRGMLNFKADKKDEAMENLQQARDIFLSLTDNEREHTANDAAFSMAETWFTAEKYDEAIEYFRLVEPKITVLRALKKKADEVHRKVALLMSRREDAREEMHRLNSLRSRYNMISESPDLMIGAYLRIAESYHKLGKYDECRIVARHLARHMDSSEKKQAYLLVIDTYIKQDLPEDAYTEINNFVLDLGPDHPELKTISLAIGQLFMRQNDIARATEMFDISTSLAGNDTEGQTEEDARYMKFSALYYDNQFSASIELADEYIQKYPEGLYVANAIYFKSVCYAGLQEWEPALVAIDQLFEKFPQGTENFTHLEEANYHKGIVLVDSKQFDKAVDHFKAYLDRVKDGELRPEMMYQLGVSLHELERPEEANDILRALAKDFPNNTTVAPYSLYQIAVYHFQKQEFEEMTVALKELIEIFPDNPIVTDGYFFLGFGAIQNRDFDGAIEWFRKSLESNPQHERAPQCLLDIASATGEKAMAMGRPTALSQELQTLYKDTVLESAKTYEDLLEQYPESDQSLRAVTGIASAIGTLVKQKQMTEEEAEKYFSDASERHRDSKELQAQIHFSKGVFLNEMNEPDKALTVFKKAMGIDPEARFSAELLLNYAIALMESDSLEEAVQIVDKVMDDYEGIESAMAPATFVMAEIKFRQKAFDLARTLYEEVLEDYPWYEDGQTGRVKLAEIYEINGEIARAEGMFTEVFTQTKGETRVSALLAVGRCQVKIAQKATFGSAEFKDKIKAANGNLMRLVTMYEAYGTQASEGLYWLGISYEANTDLQNAANAYGRLVKSYPKSEWVPKARERLTEIGRKGIIPQTTAAAGN